MSARAALPPARSRSDDRAVAFTFALPTALLLLALTIYPFLQATLDSMFKLNLSTRAGPFVGADNYLVLAGAPDVHAALWRTLEWVVANVAIQTVLGLVIALLLNAQLRGQTIARALVLFPYMVPAIVVALVFRFMFNDITGIVNYLLVSSGLLRRPVAWLSSPDSALWAAVAVNCWKYTPFMVIVFLARLQTVPLELYDAARIDGASAWAVFRYITFPWLRPVLLIAMLLRTIWTANDFDLLYLLAFGGPLSSTTTVPLLIRALAFGKQDIGMASALALCAGAFLCMAAFVYLRLYQRSERQLQ
jgi:multiple sugar transport system permease protein